MARITLDRYGKRHTGRILADSESDGSERAVYHVSYQAGTRSDGDTRIALEFRVTLGRSAHKTFSVELSGAEFSELVEKIATSTLQVDYHAAFNLTDRLRRIFYRH